jgi:hypothetical protein
MQGDPVTFTDWIDPRHADKQVGSDRDGRVYHTPFLGGSPLVCQALDPKWHGTMNTVALSKRHLEALARNAPQFRGRCLV